MPVSALPQQVAFFTETSFVTGGPADWSANGTFFYCIEPDKAGLAQAVLENENNVLRPRATHQQILGLKNGNVTFGIYMHGSTANAAEGAAAVTYHVAELLRAALGGRDLGYAAAVVSSEAEDTDEVEIDADPGYEQGDWIFLKDADGHGEFYRIESIAAGPPVTLTLDRDLHFTPDTGGADTIHAVIDCYIHQSATTQYNHASHKTLQLLMQGDHEEDVDICRGCKPQVTIEPITPGEPSKLNFDVLVTDFDSADEAAKEDFGAATPVGEAGLVPGKATSTYFKMATFESPLATVRAIGSITCDPGVKYERITGPNGTAEGVHGHIDTLDPPTLEVMVEFDADYKTEFRAKTFKHALVQVGDDLQAWGIYYPKLSYSAEPARGNEGGITTCSLSFIAHENSASYGSLTGDSREKWRSMFRILMVA